MLWHKAWLETRWRFITGLVLLVCSAATSILLYPKIVPLLKMGPPPGLTGELGARVAEVLQLSQTFRGYLWSQFFNNNLPTLWSIFAVLIGTGGLLSQVSRGGAIFTLSLPVSRRRLVGVRAVTGLGEILVLALVPSVLVSLLSPAIGESYRLGDALVHGLCVFMAGTVFFSLTFLLSSIFLDIWRPLLIALALAMVLSFIAQLFPGVSSYSVFGVMGAESYFRAGQLPWLGLLVTAAASAIMLHVAALNLARRDF
jgi:ABC-type transport system involved in multi-copper enzyme maturation permease subunit